MLENELIAFIGAGAMGSAMVKGVLSRRIVVPNQIIAADPSRDICDELVRSHEVNVTRDNVVACKEANIIVLSVKPEVLDKVFRDLSGCVGSDALVISIVAGAKLDDLIEGLSHKSVIRCMPNTPAQIGKGITVWTQSVGVSGFQHEQAVLLLESLGRQMFVDDEKYLDMATALSGSGPAYVFLFIEALVEAGVNIGFSRTVAEELVHTTVKGSVDYAMNSSKDLLELRTQVTSPGGTTEAALCCFEAREFRTIVSNAVAAAYQRSIELGKNK